MKYPNPRPHHRALQKQMLYRKEDISNAARLPKRLNHLTPICANHAVITTRRRKQACDGSRGRLGAKSGVFATADVQIRTQRCLGGGKYGDALKWKFSGRLLDRLLMLVGRDMANRLPGLLVRE